MTLKYNYNSPIMNKYLNNRVSNYRLSRYGWSRGYNRGLGNFGLCGGVVRQQIIYSTPKQSKSAERIQNVAMICSAIGALGTSIAGIITACKAGGVQTSSNSVNDISKSVQNKVDSSGTTVDTSTYSTDNGADIKKDYEGAITASKQCKSDIDSAMKKCKNSHTTEDLQTLKDAIEKAEEQKTENEQKIKEYEQKIKEANDKIEELKNDQKEKTEKYNKLEKERKELKKEQEKANEEFDKKKKEVEKLKKQIETKEKKLKNCKKDSEEYNKLKKEISELRSDFKTEEGNLNNLAKSFNKVSDEYKEKESETQTAKTEMKQAERAYSIESSNCNSIISYAEGGISALKTQNNTLTTSITSAKAELSDISIDEPEPQEDSGETMTA